MDSIIEIQKRLLPDLLSTMQKRHQILQYINLMQPVGRRSLSVSLGITERILRSEVDFLKSQNLVSIAGVGMSLTHEGKELLDRLESIMRDITGIDKMERALQEKLGAEKVVIVSGDSDHSPWVKSELGRSAASCMKAMLDGKNIIAVTGGSTMASVANMLTPEVVNGECLFVPARGGIGEDMQNQANTICATMAERTHSKHRVLYVPDQVSSDMYQSIIKDPDIKEVLQIIKSASMVLHGIGDAITMAERRKTNSEVLDKMIADKAVGEAFGYYFNEKGEVVHKVQTIGLQLEDLTNANHVIAVAGGASKEKAIRSYMIQASRKTILITDEGAAKRLLQG